MKDYNARQWDEYKMQQKIVLWINIFGVILTNVECGYFVKVKHEVQSMVTNKLQSFKCVHKCDNDEECVTVTLCSDNNVCDYNHQPKSDGCKLFTKVDIGTQ